MAQDEESLIEVIDDSLADRVLKLNPNCKKLNLSHNKIRGLEPGEKVILLGKQLQNINVSSNLLTDISKNWNVFCNLQVLDLSHNNM